MASSATDTAQCDDRSKCMNAIIMVGHTGVLDVHVGTYQWNNVNAIMQKEVNTSSQ